jgi:hypothetical protein
VRAQSKQRRGEARLRQAILETVIERDGNACHAAMVVARHYRQGCGWPITCAGEMDGHEVIPRSRWPGGHLVATNVRMCCRRHHDWIHAHPVTATTLGLLAPSWERP